MYIVIASSFRSLRAVIAITVIGDLAPSYIGTARQKAQTLAGSSGDNNDNYTSILSTRFTNAINHASHPAIRVRCSILFYSAHTDPQRSTPAPGQRAHIY
uniref:Uncharacterized protein n=1 Tax=Schizaphis graminum TaxID=13262 RepID=A0A2S2NZM1_SCHGA